MIRAIFLCVLGFLSALPATADQLPSPKGAVLLTISGDIAYQNAEGVAMFDRDMLEALDWQEIRTFTPFSDGEQVFEGPTLVSLLEAVGAKGNSIDATAINDYSIAIPVPDAQEHDILLAMVWNGKVMRVRDKGPIWVVYPLSEAGAAEGRFASDMIWQLDRLSIH